MRCGIWGTHGLCLGKTTVGRVVARLCLPAWEGDGVPSMKQEAFSRAPDMTSRLEASVASFGMDYLETRAPEEKLKVANKRCGIICPESLAGRPLK